MGGIVGAAVVYANYFHAIDLFEGHGVRTLSTASLFSTYSVGLPFESRALSSGSQCYCRYQARLHDKCVLLLFRISRNNGPCVYRLRHERQEQLPTTCWARSAGSIYSHLGNRNISGNGDRYVLIPLAVFFAFAWSNNPERLRDKSGSWSWTALAYSNGGVWERSIHVQKVKLRFSVSGFPAEFFCFPSQYWLWCPILAPILGAQCAALIYDAGIYVGDDSILNKPYAISYWDTPQRLNLNYLQ